MRPEYVIQGPVLSEKAVTLSASKVYAIKVAAEASKDDIRTALKQTFGVDVVKINTGITRGKSLRRSRSKKGGAITVKRPNVKKAYVVLKDGQELPLPVLATDEGTETK